MPTQQYTISHTGSVLGEDEVEVSTNQVAPRRESVILTFECPDNYDAINYVGKRDATRFVPRTLTEETVADADGDGNLSADERTVAVDGDLSAVAGERDLDEQPYPVVQVVNVTTGERVPNDGLDVDYARNEVTVSEDHVSGGDTLKVFSVMVDGTFKFYGVNALGQDEGPIDRYGFPIRRFADMKQDKRGTEINLDGSVTWEPFETLQVRLDAPQEIVWTDDDHPEAYVSTFEQDVEISF